jgi:putative holliday junction resolvase
MGVCKALEGRKKEIDALVIGLPLLLNGKEGDMAKAALQFGEKLKVAFEKPVHFVDERMTSKAAEQGLREMDLNRRKRTKLLDSGSAALILQTFLDQR